MGAVLTGGYRLALLALAAMLALAPISAQGQEIDGAMIAAEADAPPDPATSGDRLVFQIVSGDKDVMNEALTNAENVAKALAREGGALTAEFVAYGDGIAMLLADSPVADRIDVLTLANPDMTFTACGNTLAARKRRGEPIDLLDGVVVAEAGVLRLMRLQQAGYIYIRP